jgi:hypothetical protein
MFRRVSFAVESFCSPRVGVARAAWRSMATYGVTLQSHEELIQRFTPAKGSPLFEMYATKPEAAFDKLLMSLEEVEQRLANWPLARWNFRIPVLVSAEEQHRSRAQLARIKSEIRLRLVEQEAARKDLVLVSEITKTPIPELRNKNRAWLQEKVSGLRWEGNVATAKELKEAWVRLEENGGREAFLLERLCCIYGLARLGTFDTAFTNQIVLASEQYTQVVPPDSKFFGKVPTGGPETARNDVKVKIDTTNHFAELMQVLMLNFPSLDILYDFLGYNVTEGYRGSLIKALTMALNHKNGVSAPNKGPSDARVLFQKKNANGRYEFLFDCKGNGNEGPDLMYGIGGKVVMITIGSDNKWLREVQLPPKRQLEGIARRVCFVMGLPFESAEVQNLMLPPAYLDRQSLMRLSTSLETDFHPSIQRWFAHYNKQLDPEMADFAEQSKKHPQEEWVRL